MFRLKREHGWPAAICTILGITVALNVWVMRVANDDPSMVVEPNYYAKAIRWDDEMAQARRNAALAWTVTPTLGATDAGRAELRVSVRDAHGAPIGGAAVTLEAFAIVRSGDVVRATLAPDGDDYRASVPMRTRGRWELRFTVVRGGDRFTAVQRVDAAAASLSAMVEPQMNTDGHSRGGSQTRPYEAGRHLWTSAFICGPTECMVA